VSITSSKLHKKSVIILQHAPHEHPGALGRALAVFGVPYRIIRLDLNQKPPQVQDCAGLLSLGGPMSANDEDEFPWIKAELKLLKAAVRGGVPTVGICLGGQLMARALGAKVIRNFVPEIGWHPVDLTKEGHHDPLLSAAGPDPTVFQWHFDTFALPKGAVKLASSPACPNQAYKIGRLAYGFQFHPEVDARVVREWCEIDGVIEELEPLGEEPWVQLPHSMASRAERAQIVSLTFSRAIAWFFAMALNFNIGKTVRRKKPVRKKKIRLRSGAKSKRRPRPKRSKK